MLIDYAFHSLADGGEPEVVGVYLVGGEPQDLGGVVAGSERRDVVYATAEEEVERGDVDAAVEIAVGLAEEVVHGGHGEPRFLLYLARHASFYRLAHVGKASRQVERAFGGLAATAHHEQPDTLVVDERHIGCAGIDKVFEATVVAAHTLR